MNYFKMFVLGYIIQILIIILKLFNVIKLSWFIILLPTIVLIIGAILIILLMMAITKLNNKFYKIIDDN